MKKNAFSCIKVKPQVTKTQVKQITVEDNTPTRCFPLQYVLTTPSTVNNNCVSFQSHIDIQYYLLLANTNTFVDQPAGLKMKEK